MTSRRSASLGRLSLAVTLGLTGACTAETGEDLSVESDELRSLTTAEVVGTISANQTVRVNYEPIPRYRALSFSGAAGDNITIAVHGLGKADPIAFLLSDSYRTLDRNDNASESNRDSLITRKLTKTGTYYVAVREVDEETSPKSKFDVTLTTSATTPPSADPFDPASCTGPALSVNGLIAKIPKGHISKDFKGRLAARDRVCTKIGGCSSWTKVDTAPMIQPWQESFYDSTAFRPTTVLLRLNLSNKVTAPPEAGIALQAAPVGDDEMREFATSVPYIANGANKVSFVDKYLEDGIDCYRDRIKAEFNEGKWHSVYDQTVDFDITLRDSCFRAVSTFSNEDSGTQQYEEVQFVLVGTY